jgi:hypothetical protein
MVNTDTATADKIIAQINAGKANTIVLKDFIVDLFTASAPDKHEEINFDKGIEWLENEFTLTHLTQCEFIETQMLGNYEVKFCNIAFDGQCTLKGWQGANLIQKHLVNFIAFSTISMVGNHIVFKTVDADKTVITATKNLL